MARPLWKELRRARSERPPGTPPTVPPPPKARFGIAIFSGLVAVAALALYNAEGGSLTRRASMEKHIWAASMAGVFLVFGSIAVRSVATQIGRLVHVGGGPTAGAAIRLIFTIAGTVVVAVVTIGILGVQATRLLAAAGVTGVIIGLAAQQSLGNVFAGVVLMVARPFSVGQRIRIRSGTLGGIFDAEVHGMGLTYVDLVTEDGPLKIPNLGMLAAGVGPAPEPKAGAGEEEPGPEHRQLHLPQEVIRQVREERVTNGGTPPDGAPLQPEGGGGT